MRKSYGKGFKAKVALEAIKEQMTVQEISQKYGVHQTVIAQWKRQLMAGAGELFERPNKKSTTERETESERDQLLKIVGQLNVEVDFLKRKYRQVYGSDPQW